MSDESARGFQEPEWVKRKHRIYNLFYLAINDSNVYDTLIFGQIMYWNGPSSHGGTRLRAKKEGKLWLAKSYKDWWKELRIKETTVYRALKRIEARGLIETKTFHFKGVPTTHIRVDYTAFRAAVDRVEHLFPDDEPDPEQPENSELIRSQRQDGNGLRDGLDSVSETESYTESTTETTTKKKTNPPKISAGLAMEEKRKKSSGTPDGSPSEEMEKMKAQEAAGPMYALIAVINKRLATRLQIKPGMKLYKEIVDTHVVITFPGGFEFDFGPMCEHYDESEVFKGWVDAKIEAAVKQGGEPGDMSLRKRIKNFIRKFDTTYNPYAEYRTQHAGNHHTCQQRFVKALEAHRAQQDANPLEKYKAKYMRVHQYQRVLDDERLTLVRVRDARGAGYVREGTASIMDYKQHWEAELPRFPEEREWLDQYNARFDYGD